MNHLRLFAIECQTQTRQKLGGPPQGDMATTATQDHKVVRKANQLRSPNAPQLPHLVKGVQVDITQ